MKQIWLHLELHLPARFEDWDGYTYDHDRYIIIDDKGIDQVGEHMPIHEAFDFMINR